MSYKELADPKQLADGTWYVQFDVTDAAGKVISKTTLTGKSEKDVWKRLQAAYVESSEAIVRLRNRKNAEKPADLSTAEEEALKYRKEATKALRDQASLEFMKRHLYTGDFNPCEANATMLFNYIDAKVLDFTADNLDVAFEQLTKQERLVPPTQVTVEVAPAPEVVTEKAIEVPWTPNPMTKKGIHDLGRAYTEYWNNKNLVLRAEFRRQVNAALSGENQ